MLKIAIIPPTKNGDYLLDTVVDGLLDLISNGFKIEFKILNKYPSPNLSEVEKFFTKEEEFIDYGKKTADVIFLCFRYKELNHLVADKIGRWDKTVFLDGSEYKHDNRFDFNIQSKVLEGKYDGPGAVDFLIKKKVAFYLRREKPYLNGILPIPFGIERRFIKYENHIQKDIDFVCMFGQDAYPIMRRYCTKILKDFCEKNNLKYFIGTTKGFSHDINKIAGREEFYSILARAKVGVSVGGGGFDTLRFWETLANNCILLTERLDIYHPDSDRLNYKRIFQFNNLFDFNYQLEKIYKILNTEYNQDDLHEEYKDILINHSSKSRALEILAECNRLKIIDF
ncbi:MAG: hypothetical protein QG583_687 [Patescibacteria group bacterium]|nr:hypothetical protein [Patescibacteria group bacterium]